MKAIAEEVLLKNNAEVLPHFQTLTQQRNTLLYMTYKQSKHMVK